MKLKSPVILALDVDSKESCLELVEQTKLSVGCFKLGPRLIVKYGAPLIREIAEIAPVFVDNKYLDIPSTMVAAVRASFEAGASLVTVHAWAGNKALAELAKLEKDLSQERPFQILVVTVLTSFDQSDLPFGLSSSSIPEQVEALAESAISSGLTGLVCSPNEVKSLKNKYPKAFFVTPGIRVSNEVRDDQQRTATPQEALAWGASALVIGRPILMADDPGWAAQEILRRIQVNE